MLPVIIPDSSEHKKAKILAFLCSDESGIMTGSIVDFDQTVAGWHSYSAYDTKILDDSILGE